MHCIVGLGNPGEKYQNTRHNVGFLLIDSLGAGFKILLTKSKWDSFIGTGLVYGQEVLLVKPLTFMNRSGLAVGKIIHFYKLQLEQVLIVHDDMDLPLGRIKIVSRGGPGGHNGVASIIAALGTNEFPHLKIGIGRPPLEQRSEDYVLTPFSHGERLILNETLSRAQEGVSVILQRGLEAAMNILNVKKTGVPCG